MSAEIQERFGFIIERVHGDFIMGLSPPGFGRQSFVKQIVHAHNCGRFPSFVV
jgi:hypothetical protein